MDNTFTRVLALAREIKHCSPVVPHEIVKEGGESVIFINPPNEKMAAALVSYYLLLQPQLIFRITDTLREARKALEEAIEVPVAAYPGRVRAKMALAEINQILAAKE